MRPSLLLLVAGFALLWLVAPPRAAAQDKAPTASAPAYNPPIRPGIGGHDARVREDPNRAPWRAVGKIQIAAASWLSSCTGALIGPALVLTAAHCLFNEHTGQFYRPAAVHFLIGADGDLYAGHAQVVSYITGTRYDHARPGATIGSDWALLKLDTKLGTPDRFLTLSDAAPAIGARVMIGGYSEDRRYILTADEDCRIIGTLTDGDGDPVLRHDCTGTRGISGAPLLVLDHGVWRIAGITVAAQMGASIGYAVRLDEVRRHL